MHLSDQLLIYGTDVGTDVLCNTITHDIKNFFDIN